METKGKETVVAACSQSDHTHRATTVKKCIANLLSNDILCNLNEEFKFHWPLFLSVSRKDINLQQSIVQAPSNSKYLDG